MPPVSSLAGIVREMLRKYRSVSSRSFFLVYFLGLPLVLTNSTSLAQPQAAALVRSALRPHRIETPVSIRKGRKKERICSFQRQLEAKCSEFFLTPRHLPSRHSKVPARVRPYACACRGEKFKYALRTAQIPPNARRPPAWSCCNIECMPRHDAMILEKSRHEVSTFSAPCTKSRAARLQSRFSLPEL